MDNSEASAYDAGHSNYSMSITVRSELESGFYGLTGGFLFLGIFLGIVFTFAAGLIIYYKQISEGYYDQGKYEIMKGTLDTRPIYVRTREHIEAHLIICLIALTMMRLLQTKIVETEMPPGNDDQKKRYWTYGLSADRIQAALKRWTIEELPDDYYRFCDVDDPDLHRILKAIDSIPEKKLYTRGELRSMKQS